jgi:hypothetical protein
MVSVISQFGKRFCHMFFALDNNFDAMPSIVDAMATRPRMFDIVLLSDTEPALEAGELTSLVCEDSRGFINLRDIGQLATTSGR